MFDDGGPGGRSPFERGEREAPVRWLADGRRGAAREHLDRSLAFFRSVGATAYEREAEALSG
jgi:hypothetical protein